MFDVGFSELLVIGVVALLVIGPEKLPRVARTVGALMGRAQRYVNDVKADISREIELDELKKLQTTVTDAAHSIESSMKETVAGFEAQASEFNKLATEVGSTTPEAAAPSAQALADADGAIRRALDTAEAAPPSAPAPQAAQASLALDEAPAPPPKAG